MLPRGTDIDRAVQFQVFRETRYADVAHEEHHAVASLLLVGVRGAAVVALPDDAL